MTWSKVKSWVQPVMPLAVLLWVTFHQPGWSPAGLIARAIDRAFDMKMLATIDTAIYSALFTYISMILFWLADKTSESWPLATVTAKVTSGWDKQNQVRLAPGSPVTIDVEVKVDFRSDEDLAKLSVRMPDLALELSWDNRWLAVSGNRLASATVRDQGDISILTIPLLKGTGVSHTLCPSLIVDVLNEETRRRALTVKLVTSHSLWRFWLVRVIRKVQFSASTLVVRLDRD